MCIRDRRQGDGETRDTGQQAADEASVAMMLQQAWAALLKEQAKQRDTAVQRLTPDPLRSDALVATDDLHFIEDDEGSLAGWQVAKTRLGDRITVIPIYQHAHGPVSYTHLDVYKRQRWSRSATKSA